MGEASLTLSHRVRWRAIGRAACVAVLGLASLQAAAEPLKLYLYRDHGMPVYSNRPPEDGIEHTLVYPGSGAARPVLSMPPPSVAAASSTDGVVANQAANQTANEAANDAAIGWAASCKGVTPEMLDQRAVRWQSLVNKHAKAHGVPVALVRAVMRVESCFDRHAVSRVGARGLMQLMPTTATQLGVLDCFDADQNIAGGVRYLSQLLERFNNNTRLAVAAYNAGPAAVDVYGGIPPFPETRSYVERVIAEYRLHSKAKPKKSIG